MKRKDLYNYIREEIISELTEAGTAMVTTKGGTRSIPFKDTTELNPLKADPNVSSITTTAGQKLKEEDLEEMARIAGSYKVGDPAKFKEAKELYGVGLYGDVLNAIEAAGEEGITQKGLEVELGKQGPVLNPILNKFKTIGVLGGGKLPKAEKPETTTSEPEAEEPEMDDFYAADVEDETPEEKPIAIGDKEVEKIAGDIDTGKSEETNKSINIVKSLSAKIKDMKKGPEREKKMAALKQYISNNKKLLKGLDINKLTDGLIGGGGD